MYKKEALERKLFFSDNQIHLIVFKEIEAEIQSLATQSPLQQIIITYLKKEVMYEAY